MTYADVDDYDDHVKNTFAERNAILGIPITLRKKQEVRDENAR